MADKLVEIGVSAVNGVYNYPPPPVDDEEQEDGSWTATVSVQGNPFTGEGASLDEAIDNAVKAYEDRGKEAEEPKPTPVAKQSTSSTKESAK